MVVDVVILHEDDFGRNPGSIGQAFEQRIEFRQVRMDFGVVSRSSVKSIIEVRCGFDSMTQGAKDRRDFAD